MRCMAFGFAKLSGALRTGLFLSGLVLAGSAPAWAQVKLNTWTVPSQGSSGTTQVNATGSGFPSGTIPPGNVTVSVAASCGGPALATMTALRVTHLLGSSDRIEFLIPASLAQNTYQVSIRGTTSTGAAFASTNCSSLKVLPPPWVLSSCLPASSMGVLLPAQGPGRVTAYVPNGAWQKRFSTGIQVVPLEGGGSPVSIPTPNAVNSCASNSATGESVCVANNTDIYLIMGSTLNATLTSGSDALVSFSGGECENCGVTINPVTNTAAITMGLRAATSSESGIQFLNLANNTFGAPVPVFDRISEDIQWDPNHNLSGGSCVSSSTVNCGVILSPGEYSPGDGSVYDLLQTSSSSGASGATSATEILGPHGLLFDSAAKDCTTGIGLASNEQLPNLYITDLTQATFTSGSPGTWTAPAQTVTFEEFREFYGPAGISVAPGSQLAIVATEFGLNQVAAVTLPSTSGSGTPNFGDYAAAVLPPTPDGFQWTQGLDPHTVTAYLSPNTGRPFGVLANSAPQDIYDPPNWLAVVDLQALLNAPRKAGVYPSGAPCSACTYSVDPSYDLVAHGVVRYIYILSTSLTLSPNAGQQGQNLVVTLTGHGTNWVQGQTSVEFGQGISAGYATVKSATSAEIGIIIDPTADPGPRFVTVFTRNNTGNESENPINGFTVTPGTPVLVSVNPNSGQQGQQNLSVNLTGQFTNWMQGTTTAGFGAGITVASLTVNSPTVATAVLNISASAATGPRTVTITNSGGVQTLANGRCG